MIKNAVTIEYKDTVFQNLKKRRSKIYVSPLTIAGWPDLLKSPKFS